MIARTCEELMSTPSSEQIYEMKQSCHALSFRLKEERYEPGRRTSSFGSPLEDSKRLECRYSAVVSQWTLAGRSITEEFPDSALADVLQWKFRVNGMLHFSAIQMTVSILGLSLCFASRLTAAAVCLLAVVGCNVIMLIGLRMANTFRLVSLRGGICVACHFLICLALLGPFSVHWMLGGLHWSVSGILIWNLGAPVFALLLLDNPFTSLVVTMALRTMLDLIVLFLGHLAEDQSPMALSAWQRATAAIIANACWPIALRFIFLKQCKRIQCSSLACKQSAEMLEQEREGTKDLISSMVPMSPKWAHVLSELDPSEWHATELFPVHFEECSVLQMDVSGFTALSALLDSDVLVDLINALFTSVDFVAWSIGSVWKVELIGDCYKAIIGGPYPCPDHAEKAVLFAHCIIGLVTSFSKHFEHLGVQLAARVGVHSGCITAGIVGTLRPRYLMFCRNSEVLNKLEQAADTNGVLASATMAQRVADTVGWEHQYKCAVAVLAGPEVAAHTILRDPKIMAGQIQNKPRLRQLLQLIRKGEWAAEVPSQDCHQYRISEVASNEAADKTAAGSVNAGGSVGKVAVRMGRSQSRNVSLMSEASAPSGKAIRRLSSAIAELGFNNPHSISPCSRLISQEEGMQRTTLRNFWPGSRSDAAFASSAEGRARTIRPGSYAGGSGHGNSPCRDAAGHQTARHIQVTAEGQAEIEQHDDVMRPSTFKSDTIRHMHLMPSNLRSWSSQCLSTGDDPPLVHRPLPVAATTSLHSAGFDAPCDGARVHSVWRSSAITTVSSAASSSTSLVLLGFASAQQRSELLGAERRRSSSISARCPSLSPSLTYEPHLPSGPLPGAMVADAGSRLLGRLQPRVALCFLSACSLAAFAQAVLLATLRPQWISICDLHYPPWLPPMILLVALGALLGTSACFGWGSRRLGGALAALACAPWLLFGVPSAKHQHASVFWAFLAALLAATTGHANHTSFLHHLLAALYLALVTLDAVWVAVGIRHGEEPTRVHEALLGVNYLLATSCFLAPIGLAAWESAEKQKEAHSLLEERNREARREERILDALVPAVVKQRFLSEELLIRDHFVDATVLFVYVADYERIVCTAGATETIRWINNVFARFDKAILRSSQHITKVETFNNFLLVFCGIPAVEPSSHPSFQAPDSLASTVNTSGQAPDPLASKHPSRAFATPPPFPPSNLLPEAPAQATLGRGKELFGKGDRQLGLGGTADHATLLVTLAGEMLDSIRSVRRPDGVLTTVKIGLSSGPVSAGMIGSGPPRYSVYGDTVNTASRMAAAARPCTAYDPLLHLTASTHEHLCSGNSQQWMWHCEQKLYSELVLAPRQGEIEVKGKGRMQTYHIAAKHSPDPWARQSDRACVHPEPTCDETSEEQWPLGP